MKYTILLLMLFMPVTALAQSETAVLRQQLEDQRALIREQTELLKAQQQKIDSMSKRLEDLEAAEKSGGKTPAQAATPSANAGRAAAAPEYHSVRDAVGDLNETAVRAGDFPGSFRIPGPGNISLAIGGFIKTVAIYDSDAENMGADFLPAILGTRSSDEEGAVSMDATITRLHLDGRAPVSHGQLRGYVECDLNDSNDGSLRLKMRHAYGSWKNDYGTLLAGHTWSTMMDLKILPEGLTEPTVSGVIFNRQAQLRWSQPLNPEFTLHAALEDPNSNDIFSDTPSIGHTSIPDAIAGLEYDQEGIWHARLNGILRNIKVELPDGDNDNETAWGLALTGHLNLFDRDKLVLSTVYGEGVGRYLLGIQSTAGSAIVPTEDEIDLRESWGGMIAYRHQWTDTLRSNILFGYAHSEPLDWQTVDNFESSAYGSVNLMWAVQSYLTLGFEYGYGIRENKDDSDFDNHRFAFGIQIF